MLKRSAWLVVIVVLLGMLVPVFAQTTITGSIQGVVKDPKGGGLPGATVTASSDALVSRQLSAMTDAKGNYRFPALPPGTYAVQVQMTGFQTAKREEVRVRVGQAIAVDVTLQITEVKEEVTVTSKAPVVSVVSNTLSTNIDEQYLKKAPLPTNYYNVIKTVPGVNVAYTNTSGSAMLAYGGTEERQNAFTLDGVNVADGASGQHWVLPSVKWFQDIEIGGLGASAEYGGYTGGIINGVTKSGGNDVHGELEVVIQPPSWTSNNDPRPAEEQPPQGEFKYNSASVTIGGPVVQDKLWFFFSGERWQTVDTPYQTAFDFRTTSANSDRVIPRYLGKLTWQASTNNRVSFMAEYDNADNERRGVSDTVLTEASSHQQAPGATFALHWESLVNSNNFLNVKLTGYDGRDDYLPYNGDTNPGHVDDDTGLAFVNQDIKQLNHRHSVALDASWTMYHDGIFAGNDSHAFKFGGGYEKGFTSDVWRRNGGYTFYDSAYTAAPDANTDQEAWNVLLADPTQGRYYIERGYGEYDAAPEYTGYSLYAQDSMRIGKWTINPGVRYGAYQAGWQPGRGTPTVYDVTFVDPRIGVVWDVKGDSTTAVKAHWGRYHDKMYTYMYDRETSGHAAIPNQDCYWDGEGYGDCDTPTVIEATMGNVEHPYVDEALLTFETQLGKNSVIGVDLADRRFRNIIAMVNTNNDYSVIMAHDNPFGGGDLPIYVLNSAPQFQLTTDNGAYRDYQAATLRFEKRHSDNWDLRASVVYTDLKGNIKKNNGYAPEYTDQNGLTNADGKMDWAYSPWEFKVGGSVDLPLHLQFSGQYTYLTGWFYTPYVRIGDLRYYGYNNSTGRDIKLTSRGSQQFPDRQLLDLRLAWTAQLGKGMGLTAALEVFNALNKGTVLDVYERWGTYYIDDEQHWYQRSNYNSIYQIEDPRTFRASLRFSF